MSDAITPIFARAVALKSEGKSALLNHLSDPQRRIDYALERLRYCLQSGVCTEVRAFSAAGRFLGRKQGVPGISFKRAFYRGEPLLDLISEEVPVKALGEVYFVFQKQKKTLFKIGFSTNFDQRFAALDSQHFVGCLGRFPGTLLDELVLHCANHSTRRVGEWFEMPKHLYPGVMESYRDHLAHMAEFEEWRRKRGLAA